MLELLTAHMARSREILAQARANVFEHAARMKTVIDTRPLPRSIVAEPDPYQANGGYGFSLPCRVLSVLDGDTVRVGFGADLTIDVRLLDCWAPELSEPGGQEAKAFLTNLLASTEPTVVFIQVPSARKDGRIHFGDVLTFGRVLGRLFLGTKDVSQIMVANGHATKVKAKATP